MLIALTARLTFKRRFLSRIGSILKISWELPFRPLMTLSKSVSAFGWEESPLLCPLSTFALTFSTWTHSEISCVTDTKR